MIALCRAELERSEDRPRRARLQYESARLYEAPLGDLDAALRHYQEARALNSRHLPTLAGLRRVLMLRGDWHGAVQALSDEADVTESPEERAALMFQRARILEERLDSRTDAARTYQSALEQVRGDASTLRALARVHRRDRDHAALRDVLDAQISLAQQDQPLLAARLSERAQLTERHTQEAEEACAFYERAVDADIMASGALWQATRLRAGRGQFSELLALERRRVEKLSDPGLRAMALSSTADVLADHLGDAAGAIALLEQAAQEVPGDLGPLRRLARLYEETGNHDDRVRTLERLEAVAGDDRLRLEFRLALADVHHCRRGDTKAAIHWLKLARQLDPANAASADALAELYRKERDWASLAAALSAREQTSDDTDLRAALHVELADLSEHQLGDVDRAIEHYQAVLSLQPRHASAFRGLGRLLRVKRRFSELAELHERAVDLAGDAAEAVSHLLESALIHEDLLNAPEAALGSLLRVLERDANHLTALRGSERLAESTGNPGLAIQFIERELALFPSGARRIELMLRVGEICERQMNDDARALSSFEQVLALEPLNRPALAAISRIHRRAGRYGELVATLRKEGAALSAGSARSQHLLSIARIVDEHLADRTLALEHYRNAHAEDPSSEAAAHALERMLAAARQFEELASHLDTRLSHLTAPDERLRVAVDLGRIRETQLARHAEALLAYDAGLAADPSCKAARMGRVRCLAQLGRADELLADLRRLSEDTSDPAVQLWCLLYSGELLEGELARPEQAIACFEQVLAREPDHRGALVALERLYEAQERTQDLVRILIQQAHVLSAKPEQVASLRELSRLASRDDGNAGIRRDSALKILEHQPGDVRALLDLELEALAAAEAAWLADVDASWTKRPTSAARRAAHRTRLAEFLEASNPVQALDQYRPALEEDPGNVGAARGIGRIAELVQDANLVREAAELEVSVVHSTERAAALLRHAARAEQAAGHREQAAAMLTRALQVYPDDADSAEALYGLLTELGQNDKLISLLTTAAGSASKPEVRAGHWISAARLLAGSRGDFGAAIAALRRVADAEPDHAPLLLELGELYLRSRQYNLAAQCLEKALQVEHDRSLATAARQRLAELYHEHLGRTEDAAALLRDVIRDAPQERRAQRRLLAIEIAAGDASAEATAQAWVRSTSGKEKAEALTTLGRLQRDAGKSAEAEHSFCQAVTLAGVDDAARGDLVHLLEKQQKAGASPNWEVYARALLDFCRGEAQPDEKVRALLEVSGVLIDRLNKPEQGYSALAAGLSIKPGDFLLQKELCARLSQARQYQRALPELYKLLELQPARLETWSDLTATFRSLGRNVEEHLAMGTVVTLGGGTDLQRATWSARQSRSELVKEGSIDATVLQAASRVILPEPVRALLAQLGTLAPKVMDLGPERYDLSTRDRVGPRGLHPSRVALDRLTRAFGLTEVDLYQAENEVPVAVVLGEPAGIVIPVNFDELADSQQTFCLARPMASIARRTHVVPAVGPDHAALLLAGAAWVVGIDVSVPGFEADRVAEAGRRLAKAVPWLSKGRFEEVARGYGTEHPDTIPAILRDLDRAALRLAMVLCDDLSCLALLRERGVALLGLPPEDVPSLLEDLLMFWVSPGAMAIRRQVGLA